MDRAAGPAEISTGSGRIRLGQIDGNAVIKNSNGDSWIGATSGTSGKTSAVISEQTKFTLSCQALDGSTYSETATVNLVPAYQER